MLYIIPAYLMVIVVGILLYVAVSISWFAILITARDPFSNYRRFALGWVLKLLRGALPAGRRGLLTDTH